MYNLDEKSAESIFDACWVFFAAFSILNAFHKKTGSSRISVKTWSRKKRKETSRSRAVSCRFYCRPNGTEGALMKCFKDGFWTIVSQKKAKVLWVGSQYVTFLSLSLSETSPLLLLLLTIISRLEKAELRLRLDLVANICQTWQRQSIDSSENEAFHFQQIIC